MIFAAPTKPATILAVTLSLLLTQGCSKSTTPASKATPAIQPTTITALIWAPDWPEEMQKIADEFTKANPEIKVDLQFMIGNSVEENIKPKIAANQFPDLMSVNPNAYAAGLADQGVLAELGDTASWNNMLEPLKADWTSSRNKHFGISGGVAATLMYYNKDIFQQAGITSLPGNFDEFLQLCEKLKKAGFTPIMWNGGFPNMLGNGPFSFGFANNVVAKHPDWKKRIADGTLDLNTADTADIFAKIKLVAERGFVQKDYMYTNYDKGIQLFTEGKTAMAFHGSWASGLLMKGNGFSTGTFVPPWNAAGKTVVPVIGSETGFAVGETPNKKAALQFLEFINGKGFVIQQNKRQNIPPFKHVQGKVLSDPQIVEYIHRASQYPVTANPYYSSLPANTIDMLHPLMLEVLLGKKTPRQAAQALDQSVKNEARDQNH